MISGLYRAQPNQNKVVRTLLSCFCVKRNERINELTSDLVSCVFAQVTFEIEMMMRKRKIPKADLSNMKE